MNKLIDIGMTLPQASLLLVLMVSLLGTVQAVTDADLEALEKQIQQEEQRIEKQLKEEKEQQKQAAEKARAAEKRRQEEQQRKKRQQAEERQRQEEEAQRQAELEQKRQEQEARRRAEQIRQQEEARLKQEVLEKLQQEEAERQQAAEQRRQEEETNRINTELAVQRAKEELLAGELVYVEGGTFTMGSSNIYSGKVDITVPSFWIGRFEVTIAQWVQVMGNNPTKYSECGRCPVTTVAWYDAKEFIDVLNRKTGGNFRLLSESEWEYACRSGGKDEKYCGSNNADAVGWYNNNAHGKKAKGVGRKQANGLDLYDMSGNVAEWVEDCWDSSLSGIPTDGSPRLSGNCVARVTRGGSWANDVGYLNASDRAQLHRTYRKEHTGFRIGRSADKP